MPGLKAPPRRLLIVVGMVLATTTVTGCVTAPTFPSFPSLYLPPVERPGSFSNLESPSVRISGHFYRPAGHARFAAVILLHGGSGLHEYVLAWARWLPTAGYAALAVDSLGSRAPGQRSMWEGGRGVSVSEQAADAYGAMAYLRTLPFIDPDRIALMGFSLGGGAALLPWTRSVAQP